MVNIKKLKNQSLKVRIRRRMIQLTLIYSILSIIIIGFLSFNEAKEQQDNLLIHIAKLVKNKNIFRGSHLNNVDKSDEEIIIYDLKSNKLSFLSNKLKDLKKGLHTIVFKNYETRIYIETMSVSGHHLFFVGQRTEPRNEYAWNNCLSFTIPTIILLLFLLLIVDYILNFHFKSLENLGKLLMNQSPLEMEPLAEKNISLEVIPFLRSLNSLIIRSKEHIIGQNFFIANAAHELRTPITAISLEVENLINSNNDERQERQIYIVKGLNRLIKMIEQLLDFSKIDKIKKVPNKRCSFLNIIKNEISELYPFLEQKNIDLDVIYEQDLFIHNNTNEINALVKNAIENAIKFSSTHGNIKIYLNKNSDQADFIVKNYGVSISKNEIKNLIEPFYKVNQNKEGSGLGLSICNKVAKKMNGQLTCEITDDKIFIFSYSQAIVNSDEMKS